MNSIKHEHSCKILYIESQQADRDIKQNVIVHQSWAWEGVLAPWKPWSHGDFDKCDNKQDNTIKNYMK